MDDQKTDREVSERALRQFAALGSNAGMIFLIINGFVDREYGKVITGLGGLVFFFPLLRNAFKK
jgi:hypothetical protein